MAASDSTPLPIKGQAFFIEPDLWLTTGLVNSGASGLDSEISKDGGSFADCTNECVEIDSSGSYTLTLTATEMTADIIKIQVKSSTANAITYKLTIYPSSAGKMLVAVQTIGGQSVSAAGTITFPGTIASTTNITAATGVDVTKFGGSNIVATTGKLWVLDGSGNDVAPASDTSAIKTKTDFLPSATAGAADGLFIAGTNDGVVITNDFNVQGSIGASNVGIGSDLSIGGNLSIQSASIATTFTITGAMTVGGGITATFNGNLQGNVTGAVATLTTYTGNTPQTGDAYARIGATGSGLTTLLFAANYTAPNNTSIAAIKTKTDFLPSITPGLTGGLIIAGSNASTTFTSIITGTFTIGGNPMAAQSGDSYPGVVKTQAATYDSVTLSGSTLTLSNGHTMVVSLTGRVTT